MKLYRARIPAIANTVITELANGGDIEVEAENMSEAELDLVSIMEEYLRRDFQLRERVKEQMSMANVGYDQFGRWRSRLAEEWNHPTGDAVGKFLARQFIENFMISRFIEEVYTEDGELWRKTLDLIRSHDVDERALREEAVASIKNEREGTVDYEIAMQKAMREVKKRKGLI